MEFNSETERMLEERKEAVDNFLLDNLHLDDGVLEDAVLHLPQAGGKRLRPLVFLLSAEVLGESYGSVVPVGAAIEGVHTASLAQDDGPLMDGHSVRRGVSTVHQEYGNEAVPLVANVLYARAFSWCVEIPKPKQVTDRVVSELEGMVTGISEGQRMDLAMEDRKDVSFNEYLQMSEKKTARMYEGSARLGSVVAEEEAAYEPLAQFGRDVGVAFQMIDDVLDFEADETGKGVYEDIRLGKKTAVTLHAQEQGVRVFDRSLGVRERAERVENVGSVSFVRGQAADRVSRALEALDDVPCDNELAREVLRDVAQGVVERTY